MIGSKPVDTVTTLDNGVELQPWQQRVIAEKEEVDQKVQKLAAYLASEAVEMTSPQERELLDRQLDVMTSYRSILSERITSWNLPS